MKAKIADVARSAGVSAATVARVLHNNGYVKEETRVLVEDAIRQTGYRPNMMARALRTSRSYALGLVVSETRLGGFSIDVAHLVQLEALKAGYTVLALNNHADASVEAIGVRRFLDHKVDAVIFDAAMDPASVRLIANEGIPTIQIERQTALVGGVVAPDIRSGMSQAVDHLYGLGHRHFAFIGGRVDNSHLESDRENAIEPTRERAFIECLGRHGLSVHPDCLQSGPYTPRAGDAKLPGYDLMRNLLALSERPTAVICGSDLFAAAALQAIHDAKLRVPEDISLIGHDDCMAEILTPPLTTIAQPSAEIARRVVAMALEAIENPLTLDRVESVPTSLVVRRSTGPALA